MNSRFKKSVSAIAVVVAVIVASPGVAACGSDTPEKVSTTAVTVASTEVEAAERAEQVNLQAWNEAVWNNTVWKNTVWKNAVNEVRWVEETNRQIAAEQARQAGLARQRESAANPTTTNVPSQGHSGDFFDCVKAHESDTAGGYSAQNPTSSASGAYQIVDGTWQNYKGYPTAASAPPHIQDERAAQLPRSAWNGSGC